MKYLLFGLGFFCLSILVLILYEPKIPFLSITQGSGSRYPYLYEPVMKQFIGIQELTLKKNYLNGIEIMFGTKGRENTNTNNLLVLDSNFNVLYKETFSSKVIIDAHYMPFRFNESQKVVKGSKIYICLFSKDGDSSNCIHPLFNSVGKLGALYASILVNDDFFNSLKNKVRLYPGSWILRTYESNIPLTPFKKSGWYVLAVLITLSIIFLKQIQVILSKVKFHPEYIFPGIALFFGLIYVFINPPFQVPDEGSHYFRTYEITDFEITNQNKTIPTSIVTIDSTLLGLHFDPEAKTSKTEILALTKVKLEPTKRHPSAGLNYIIPYIPQVLGFAVGRVFGANPVYLLYLGRIFNLILAILLIFNAIKIAPFSKWIFFLLALMPKTVYLMASLSYDAFVISGSFLLIALYLYYAFKAEKVLGWKDIGLLFFVSMLLALCKPPYFFIGFLFLIIPVRKIGSLLKFLLIFFVFVVSMLMAEGMWSLVGGLVKSAVAVKSEQVAAEKSKLDNQAKAATIAQSAISEKSNPKRPEVNQTSGDDGKGSKESQQEIKPQQPPRPEINPGGQINYLRTHLPAFINLLIVTNFDHMRANMLDNFVGTMGWLDTFLPDTLVNFYLILLLITALCISEQSVYLDWRRKTFFFILFLGGILAIETAMYVFSSFVGQERLFGIQGRYFIPLAPLFLLIFYNTAISEKLNYLFNPKRSSYLKAKPKLKPGILLEIQGEQIFTKYMQVFIIGFTVFALSKGIAAILLRYYIW